MADDLAVLRPSLVVFLRRYGATAGAAPLALAGGLIFLASAAGSHRRGAYFVFLATFCIGWVVIGASYAVIARIKISGSEVVIRDGLTRTTACPATEIADVKLVRVRYSSYSMLGCKVLFLDRSGALLGKLQGWCWDASAIRALLRLSGGSTTPIETVSVQELRATCPGSVAWLEGHPVILGLTGTLLLVGVFILIAR